MPRYLNVRPADATLADGALRSCFLFGSCALRHARANRNGWTQKSDVQLVEKLLTKQIMTSDEMQKSASTSTRPLNTRFAHPSLLPLYTHTRHGPRYEHIPRTLCVIREIHLRLVCFLNEKGLGQLYATASQSHGRFAYPSCSRPDGGGSTAAWHGRGTATR